MTDQMKVMMFATDLGRFRIFWQLFEKGPGIVNVMLPGLPVPERFRHADYAADDKIVETGEKIQACCEGVPVVFSLDNLMLDRCPGFQRHVLMTEYSVPRGAVTTYGKIAKKLGNPRAGRAVGQALANNPFPIIIPCHRVLRSDGSLGGYQGGLPMKRRLLAFEGIQFNAHEKYVGPYYSW